MFKNEGIEHTHIIDNVNGLDVRKVKGIALVVPFYGAHGCYANAGSKQTIYGFYFNDQGYWFKRKSDALYAAEWVTSNNWDGLGDLEIILTKDMVTKYIAGGHQGKLPELGKMYGG